MPRKAPDGKGVIEHRITLGNKEREELHEFLEAKKFEATLNPFKGVITGVVGAGGLAGMGYLIYAWWNDLWPFDDSPQTFFGFGFIDQIYQEQFLSVIDSSREKEEQDLKICDDNYAKAQDIVNKLEPNTIVNRMTIKLNQRIIDTYPQRRQAIIDKYAQLRERLGKLTDKVAERSEYV